MEKVVDAMTVIGFKATAEMQAQFDSIKKEVSETNKLLPVKKEKK
jgi:predicted transcriptional regulator